MMYLDPNNYQPIHQDEQPDEEVVKGYIPTKSSYTYNNLLKDSFGLSLLCILATIIFNAFLYSQYYNWKLVCVESSKYAGLTRSLSVPWTLDGPYFNQDEVLTDEAWESISIDAGAVALADEYVSMMGLPTSQRFPWDDAKGIYNINAYHSLHCLKMIRESLRESQKGLQQSSPFEHQLHCVDALRQEVICNADDTPRYTGSQPHKSSGLGQVRQCRNWNDLEAWAADNTACYRYINYTQPEFDSLERYKFCPEGSPYSAKIHEIFG